ncbi:MAG TPA: NADH-quinone oxidoreductase subunit J [Bdellovibrionota bacterium]|nr:NADH-quinone oxidoreductase subunit J [Bdellovibrionota bacterium]
MIHWAFAFVTVAGGLAATFAGGLRLGVLSLWVAGLGIGAIYLTLGAELLAVIQWIISTMVSISFVFFSVMFGEYGAGNGNSKTRRTGLIFGASLGLGLAFAAVIWLGAGTLPENMLVIPQAGNDLRSLGKKISEEHFLSLEVLALTLFTVLVGGGVIARPQAGQDDTVEESQKPNGQKRGRA